MSIQESYMLQAIDLAKKGRGRVAPNPLVGCVIVKDQKIIGEGYHRKFGGSHAEVDAINNCTEAPHDADLYVTLEPCHMCAKAIVDARLKSLVFAAHEPKTGSVNSIDNFLDKNFLNHKVEYQSGLLADESSALLKEFFTLKR